MLTRAGKSFPDLSIRQQNIASATESFITAETRRGMHKSLSHGLLVKLTPPIEFKCLASENDLHLLTDTYKKCLSHVPEERFMGACKNAIKQGLIIYNSSSHTVVEASASNDLPGRKPVIDAFIVVEGTHISYLAVSPLKQRQGIASKLINEVLELLTKAGAPIVDIYTRSHNSTAINLYTKLGFNQVNITGADKYPNGDIKIILAKDLTPTRTPSA